MNKPQASELIKKYQFDLSEIPVAHHDLFIGLNKAVETAFIKYIRKDKSLTRTETGYYVVINDELVDIKQYKQDAPEGLYEWWIASEASGLSKWYSDLAPTLKDLVKSLGL